MVFKCQKEKLVCRVVRKFPYRLGVGFEVGKKLYLFFFIHSAQNNTSSIPEVNLKQNRTPKKKKENGFKRDGINFQLKNNYLALILNPKCKITHTNCKDGAHYNYRWVLVFSWYLCLLIAHICKQPSLSMENRGVCSQVCHDTARKDYALCKSPKAFWSLWSGPVSDLSQSHQLIVKHRINSMNWSEQMIWTKKYFSFQMFWTLHVFINWKSPLILSKTCIPVFWELKCMVYVSQIYINC